MKPTLYRRIREILETARTGVARSVNTTQVVANWLIGREIVEEEQHGAKRAGYGEELVRDLAQRLTKEFGRGYSRDNLFWFRRFYGDYPEFLSRTMFDAARQISRPPAIVDALRQISGGTQVSGTTLAPATKSYAARSQSKQDISDAARRKSAIRHTLCDSSWQPGQLHLNLAWTHYRTLLRVEKPEARSFYEIEAVKNNWSARELERQINSLLYERLALSRDKKGLLRLARQGQEIQGPLDVFKDPLMLEFLRIPAAAKLTESDLEAALLNELQAFLLELGKGFAFVARQERITLEGDHFYIDLVFYHVVLKCFVLVDLKVRKLTHEDLGQFQLYLNYYDRERRTPGDQPTLGLLLCTDKNAAVVRYTLGEEQQKKIFTSRYKLHLPSEAELRAEIRRELRELRARV